MTLKGVMIIMAVMCAIFAVAELLVAFGTANRKLKLSEVLTGPGHSSLYHMYSSPSGNGHSKADRRCLHLCGHALES